MGRRTCSIHIEIVRSSILRCFVQHSVCWIFPSQFKILTSKTKKKHQFEVLCEWCWEAFVHFLHMVGTDDFRVWNNNRGTAVKECLERAIDQRERKVRASGGFISEPKKFVQQRLGDKNIAFVALLYTRFTSILLSVLLKGVKMDKDNQVVSVKILDRASLIPLYHRLATLKL